MLDARASTLLKTLVEKYIDDGQPVGSRALSKLSRLDLSPATIRNVMADLEEMGFVSSPHTSAGRVPTPKGFRLFVDSLLTVQNISEDAVKPSIESRTAPQRIISSAANTLSQLTQFTGIVMTPHSESAFSQIEFLRLSAKRILLVIVTPAGDVQNRLLLTERDYKPSELTELSNYINANYAGLSFLQIRQRLKTELTELRSDLTRLMQAAIDAGDEAVSAQDGVVIAGEKNLLNFSDFTVDTASLRKLFNVFEQKTELMALLDMSSRASGIQIYIGGESEVLPMQEMSAVTAPYSVDGRVVGTLGVIGPTRMAYQKVIPIVDITARLLSNALTGTRSEND